MQHGMLDAADILIDREPVIDIVAHERRRRAGRAEPREIPRRFEERIERVGLALGRGLEPSDMPAVRRIVGAAEADGHRWSAIVDGIVTSVPFRFASSERAGS